MPEHREKCERLLISYHTSKVQHIHKGGRDRRKELDRKGGRAVKERQ